MNYLNKKQALELMNKGYKVTHVYFEEESYLHIVNGEMLSEDGYKYQKEFDGKSELNWTDGWYLYKKQ